MMHKYLECACFSPEHVLRFSYDETDNFLACYTQLNASAWYKRIWIAIKYVFGYECRYGHWDEFVFDSKSALHVKYLCHQFLVKGEKHE